MVVPNVNTSRFETWSDHDICRNARFYHGRRFHEVRADVHRQRHPIGEQMVGSHRQRDSVGRVTNNAIRQVLCCIFLYSELYTIQFRQQLSSLARERGFDARRRWNRCNSADFRRESDDQGISRGSATIMPVRAIIRLHHTPKYTHLPVTHSIMRIFLTR